MLIKYTPITPDTADYIDEHGDPQTELVVYTWTINGNAYSFNGNNPLDVPDADADILLQNEVFAQA